MCRDYPFNLLYSTNPVFLERCGYHAVYKNAEGMREALEKLDLPEEKPQKLKRELHIRDHESSEIENHIPKTT